jgi:hypothetical protein
MALVRERTIPTKRPPLVGEFSANFLQIEGVAWSAQRIPPVVNLGFPDRSPYFFLQAASQLSSRGWVTPFQTRRFSENLEAPGIEPGASGPVSKNSDHQTTEAVRYLFT